MQPWLSDAAERVASAAGVDAAELAVDEATAGALLDLARIAAHDSGDRTNAPLLCYLVGLAQGQGGVALPSLLAAASASEQT